MTLVANTADAPAEEHVVSHAVMQICKHRAKLAGWLVATEVAPVVTCVKDPFLQPYLR